MSSFVIVGLGISCRVHMLSLCEANSSLRQLSARVRQSTTDYRKQELSSGLHRVSADCWLKNSFIAAQKYTNQNNVIIRTYKFSNLQIYSRRTKALIQLLNSKLSFDQQAFVDCSGEIRFGLCGSSQPRCHKHFSQSRAHKHSFQSTCHKHSSQPRDHQPFFP